MNQLSKIGFLILLAVAVLACKKKECDDTDPFISFKSIQPIASSSSQLDSLLITINFKDCDGDIGLPDSYVSPPFDTAGKFYHNLIYEKWNFSNGKWKTSPNPKVYNERIRPIQDVSLTKKLEGEISKGFVIPILKAEGFDTIKFKIRLIDRAKNISNEAETNAIILP